jgi:hypothetical protein
MLIDSAGWHTANDLRVLPNITLVHLPPYSPELNAIEKVGQSLQDRYLSGRLFAGTRAIVEARCTAWSSLIAEAGRIRSLADFEWARQVSTSCAWYDAGTSAVRAPWNSASRAPSRQAKEWPQHPCGDSEDQRAQPRVTIVGPG